MMRRWAGWLLLLSVVLAACTNSRQSGRTLFALLPASSTGITFSNNLKPTPDLNTYTFRNFYDGGGVALADVNNDGLLDIYFTGNSVGNRLYLNKGNFHFEDITKEAGVGCDSLWSTGATFADVNGDGLPDLFVCISGPPGGKNRHNKLFINQGVGKDGIPHFKDESVKYGLAHSGLSMQAAFFDYDGDGYLDMYLLNNPIRSVINFSEKTGAQRKIADPLGGNKLYRNDGGHFVDVTTKAGIYSSIIGFGLGVSVGDLNRDGWPDLYISNDFFERDYLYLNNHDGTFREVLPKEMQETSLSSMGADIADINNDGWPDVFVTDMLPENESRYRTKTSIQTWQEYQQNENKGYYHQFTRNTLQLNNGDGTFSEIGRLAGVDATDWSWGALLFDMENSGYNDIFVANGIYRDLLDQDYIHTMSNPRAMNNVLQDKGKGILKLIGLMPSVPVSNYAFHNNDDLTFSDSSKAWGIVRPGFSNGAAYGDLNNDGALDLVVNNVNMPAFIYENRSTKLRPQNHWLTVILKGNPPNTGAIGAEVTLWANGHQYYRYEMPTRGFESSSDPRLHFGLGKVSRIDSLQVRWPGAQGQVSEVYDVAVDQFLTLNQKDAPPAGKLHWYHPDTNRSPKPLLSDVTAGSGIDWIHREDHFDDFTRNPLLFQVRSNEGPKICVGDVNGDGLPDFYVGGAKKQPGALFIQQKDGRFRKMKEPAFEKDRISEDAGCAFFDADGDGDQDLYVASGSDEFPSSSQALLDRLYLNDGHGHFTRSPGELPTTHYVSSSAVRAADFNRDGREDLFVGERLKPFDYGIPTGGYLLENEGKGKFRDVTGKLAPGLKHNGMITDAVWCDYNHDGYPDLVVAGEWMGIQVWRNDKGLGFTNVTSQLGLDHLKGWWNVIAKGDLNEDGRPDFVVGNLGLNSQLKAGRNRPVLMYVGDFNGSGLVKHIMTAYRGKESYPVVLRQDLLRGFPEMIDKYPTFKSYRNQKIGDIFTPEQLKSALVDTAEEFRSVELLSEPDGKYKVIPLPARAQFSPVYAIAITDVNDDGHQDVILGGNQYEVKPQLGRYDASWGDVFLGDGKGHLHWAGYKKSGFRVRGQIRDLRVIDVRNGIRRILVAVNNDSLRVFKIRK